MGSRAPRRVLRAGAVLSSVGVSGVGVRAESQGKRWKSELTENSNGAGNGYPAREAIFTTREMLCAPWLCAPGGGDFWFKPKPGFGFG
jgi:hypothetical protein